MKEIKAYVRPEKIDAVVHALENYGIENLTLIDVAAVGQICDPDSCKYSVEFVEKYSRIVKLELVTDDPAVDDVVSIIMDKGHTGLAGDGIIFVFPVATAYRIRSQACITQVIPK